jgi:hypothetical protein
MIEIKTSQTETTIEILSGVRRVLLEMNHTDHPIAVDEVFVVVLDGLRLNHGIDAIHAKAALDGAIIFLANLQDEGLIDDYLARKYNLYDRVMFDRGRLGMIEAIDCAIGVARRDLASTQAVLRLV